MREKARAHGGQAEAFEAIGDIGVDIEGRGREAVHLVDDVFVRHDAVGGVQRVDVFFVGAQEQGEVLEGGEVESAAGCGGHADVDVEAAEVGDEGAVAVGGLAFDGGEEEVDFVEGGGGGGEDAGDEFDAVGVPCGWERVG